MRWLAEVITITGLIFGALPATPWEPELKPVFHYTYEKMAADSSRWKIIIVVNTDLPEYGGQNLTLFIDGVKTYFWPVSTALEGKKKNKYKNETVFATSVHGRFHPYDMDRHRVSGEWNEPMPFAIFFAKGGVAFHAANGPKQRGQIGQRASAGCVRLLPEHAEILWNLVGENFRDTLVIMTSGFD